MRFIPTPPWQHVLRRAREVCFGGLWVRFIPSAVGLGSWRTSHASCKNRSQTSLPRYLRPSHPPGQRNRQEPDWNRDCCWKLRSAAVCLRTYGDNEIYRADSCSTKQRAHALGYFCCVPGGQRNRDRGDDVLHRERSDLCRLGPKCQWAIGRTGEVNVQSSCPRQLPHHWTSSRWNRCWLGLQRRRAMHATCGLGGCGPSGCGRLVVPEHRGT